MQDSTFVGFDVKKATISVSVAHGSVAVRSATGGRFRSGPVTFVSWLKNWQRAEADCISATRRAHAAMACIASLSSWGMTASSWRPRSSR